MPTTIGALVLRYFGMFAGLAFLVAAGRYLHLNPTTAALVFLIGVLLVSANWGLRYAVVLAIVATTAFNFFQPLLGRFLHCLYSACTLRNCHVRRKMLPCP